MICLPILRRSVFAVSILLLTVTGAACRKSGEAAGPGAGEERGRKTARARHGDGEAQESARKERKGDPERLQEAEEGWVTLDAAVLDCLPAPFKDYDSKFSQDLAAELKLSPSAYEELAALTPGLLQRVKEAQLEPLGSLEFPVDKTVVIPGLAAGPIDKFVAEFRSGMPADVDEEVARLLVQMFRRRLENEYGEDLRITLRRNGSISLHDLRGSQELLGLKFEVVRASQHEGRPVQRQAVHAEGSRYDFLKVPPGVKGMTREEIFKQ